MELIQSSSQRADDDARTQFASWVGPHWELMRRVAWRQSHEGDAEDVLQNALLAAWRHRGRFDEAKGSAAAWLVTITVNEARKSHRARMRRDLAPDEPDGLDNDVRADLRAAIRMLPRRQAMTIELHYYVGLPIRDTAAVLGCAEGTVKSTLAAARHSLQQLLGEDYR